MSGYKKKVEHRLVRSLGEFKTMQHQAKMKADKEALEELCKRQAELWDWVIATFPDRSRRKPGATEEAGDTF